MNKVKTLPFFHGSCEEKGNDGFPEVLPIDIYFDSELQMFRCKPYDHLIQTLNDVYLKGSLVDGSISNKSGEVYVSDLSNYVSRESSLDLDSRILEIGFGKGVILKELKKMGYLNLVGIEPGNHELLTDMDDIEIINDFFPTEKIADKLDVIYHFAVWEHVPDPVVFIKDQLAQLKDFGSVVFGVPNCEPYVKNGDISMFLHEHYSYFTTESIKRVVKLAGGLLMDVRVIQGMIVGRITSDATKFNDEMLSSARRYTDNDFWKKVAQIHASLDTFFQKFKSESEVAVFAPGRAINAFHQLGITNVRLVDDNPEIKNKYLPGLNFPVESLDDICTNPPKAILIYSTTFGDMIKQKCLKREELSHTLIVTLDEIT